MPAQIAPLAQNPMEEMGALQRQWGTVRED